MLEHRPTERETDRHRQTDSQTRPQPGQSSHLLIYTAVWGLLGQRTTGYPGLHHNDDDGDDEDDDDNDDDGDEGDGGGSSGDGGGGGEEEEDKKDYAADDDDDYRVNLQSAFLYFWVLSLHWMQNGERM